MSHLRPPDPHPLAQKGQAVNLSQKVGRMMGRSMAETQDHDLDLTFRMVVGGRHRIDCKRCHIAKKHPKTLSPRHWCWECRYRGWA